jgi:pyruvate dehydrogenase E1 component beta subunit
MKTMTMASAIAEAHAEEMARDERVFVLGEDVGKMGGAFYATEGLFERFGPSRVIDMPISEAGIVGTAIGAALSGMRPVAEIQYIEFLGYMDPLINHAAKFHYMSRNSSIICHEIKYACPWSCACRMEASWVTLRRIPSISKHGSCTHLGSG